ncbi:hypothetical protein [Jeotgalibacillus campisalis]|uniref:Uncharacterized protein n=1 Tax=Jeotgalibacillus campisalis TaxID=220754 RepID=A0A0C2RWP2_9BACL|nr:hypothetical protein [Jeotgalibacillus campisalis]KIL46179.1 hypothetical protein KR50_28540 [Jeotgalibacillus campisalis]
MEIGDAVRHIKTGWVGVIKGFVIFNYYPFAICDMWCESKQAYFRNTLPITSIEKVETVIEIDYNEILKEQYILMAKATNDHEWLKELTEKEVEGA